MVPAGYALTDLQHIAPSSAYYHSVASQTDMRLQMIHDTAEKLGMQTALAVESEVINKVLVSHAGQLDRIFNFRLLMFNDHVLPPVITTASDYLAIDESGRNIRIGGKNYRVLQQVHFVTVSPTWRDYLWMNYPYPEYPSISLLPKTPREVLIWQASISSGWNEGIAQALSIYRINLETMLRDFSGMALYQRLLLENMISPYHVTQNNYGVTGGANAITIDDRAWALDAVPALQVHSQYWQPVLALEPVISTPASALEASTKFPEKPMEPKPVKE